MKSRVVDLNADVRAIRRLRAAAVFPQLSALCCVVIALLFVALEEDGWVTGLGLLTGAVLLIGLARGTERGAPFPLGFLTAVLTAMTGVAVVTMWIEPASMLERAQFAAGAMLMLMPCWILVSLGWTARGHRAIVSAVHDLSGGAWKRIPREHRSRKATISFAVATLLYATGLVPAGLAVAAVGGHLWVVGLVYAPIAAVAGRMWTRGRRQSALGVQEVRRLDSRSPVLLLRSFADDNLPLEKRYRLFSFLFTAREALTLESFVVDQMWRWGPVLAIGKPSEHLSPLGAAREYIPEDRWRSRVQEYLNESRFVVCILGATGGLSWEYGQLREHGKDEGALIVFPPRQPEELQRRWNRFQSIFARAQSLDLQWEPFIGVPLLALFVADTAVVFYCKYRHETAYAAAFSRLFELVPS